MRRIIALATVVALAGIFAGCVGPEEPAGGPDCPDVNDTANFTNASNLSEDCPPHNTTDDNMTI